MGWETEDGRHEGWAGMELADGLPHASSNGQGVIVEFGGYGQPARVVPYREVTGWRGRCECGWKGDFWTRVTDQAQADPRLRRFFVAAEDYADAPSDVEDAIYAEWRAHIKPDQLVTEVGRAAEHAARARVELDEAVQAARGAGASWAAIGSAVGITRQSARERWGALNR